MRVAKKKSLSPTELIDWLNDEGVIDLDWDFPEDGDLIEAGLDSAVVLKLVVAIHDQFEIELEPTDLTGKNLATPTSLAAFIADRIA
jgi:acyl carrier protein